MMKLPYFGILIAALAIPLSSHSSEKTGSFSVRMTILPTLLVEQGYKQPDGTWHYRVYTNMLRFRIDSTVFEVPYIGVHTIVAPSELNQPVKFTYLK